MYFEHFVYQAAIAVIVGMFLVKWGYKDWSWLIILFAVLPDIDHFNNFFWDAKLLPLSIRVIPGLYIGEFHNIVAMVILSLIVAAFLEYYTRIELGLAWVLVMIAYAAHLIEDYLVYTPDYKFLYPFIDKRYGIDLIHETKNLFIGDTRIFLIGFILLACAICIRIWYEPTWIKFNRK